MVPGLLADTTQKSTTPLGDEGRVEIQESSYEKCGDTAGTSNVGMSS